MSNDPVVTLEAALKRIEELEAENAQLKQWIEAAKGWLPNGWDNPEDDSYDEVYQS